MKSKQNKIKMKIEKTKYYSYSIGKLAKGCRQCVKGEKLVIYITGLCPRKCFYCPLSDTRKNKDKVWANERPITNMKDAITEAELCNAKGAGITGGDPLLRMQRTLQYIKQLKKTFGEKFHIHLYTSLDLIDEKKMSALSAAGLDEIRFHADVYDNKLWDRIKIANEFKWDVGIEIPVIPGKLKETKQLIDYFSGKIDFINFNELEISDTNSNRIIEEGFVTKDNISYGVKGSEQMAKKLLIHCVKKKLSAHYCPTKLKDKVQLANRIKRRAKNVAKEFDIITKEGTLIRGAIYIKKPSFGKAKPLNAKDKTRFKTLITQLKKKFDIPAQLFAIDMIKSRILTAATVTSDEEVKLLLKERGLIPAIVEEYPTYDMMQVELQFL